jgi:hypothetical protein
MSTRYRVESARPGLEHAPGLVGDYEKPGAARKAARLAKDSRPEDRVTIQLGEDVPWAEQPAARRHPHGHHFLSDGSEPEVVD